MSWEFIMFVFSLLFFSGQKGHHSGGENCGWKGGADQRDCW